MPLLGDLELEVVVEPAAKRATLSGGLRSVFRSSLAYLLLILSQRNKPRGSSGPLPLAMFSGCRSSNTVIRYHTSTSDQRIPLVKLEWQ